MLVGRCGSVYARIYTFRQDVAAFIQPDNVYSKPAATKSNFAVWRRGNLSSVRAAAEIDSQCDFCPRKIRRDRTWNRPRNSNDDIKNKTKQQSLQKKKVITKVWVTIWIMLRKNMPRIYTGGNEEQKIGALPDQTFLAHKLHPRYRNIFTMPATRDAHHNYSSVRHFSQTIFSRFQLFPSTSQLSYINVNRCCPINSRALLLQIFGPRRTTTFVVSSLSCTSLSHFGARF